MTFIKTVPKPFISPVDKIHQQLFNNIIDSCCEIWGVNKDYLFARRRISDAVTMRGIIVTLLHKKYSRISLSLLGIFLGGYDHTTIIHLLRTTEERLDIKDALTLAYYEPVKHLAE